MSISSLQDLFVHTLKDIYFAENLIVKKLPTMTSEASAAPLKQAFEAHLEESKGHVKRLEEIFSMIGETAKGEECPAIEGIMEEAEQLLAEISNAKTKDAALIAAAQAVEHYEITRYGTLVSWAKQLGHTEIIALLRETLAEEKEADNKLMRLGEDQINQKAA